VNEIDAGTRWIHVKAFSRRAQGGGGFSRSPIVNVA
jgi:hypothetical protein